LISRYSFFIIFVHSRAILHILRHLQDRHFPSHEPKPSLLLLGTGPTRLSDSSGFGPTRTRSSSSRDFSTTRRRERRQRNRPRTLRTQPSKSTARSGATPRTQPAASSSMSTTVFNYEDFNLKNPNFTDEIGEKMLNFTPNFPSQNVSFILCFQLILGLKLKLFSPTVCQQTFPKSFK